MEEIKVCWRAVTLKKKNQQKTKYAENQKSQAL